MRIRLHIFAGLLVAFLLLPVAPEVSAATPSSEAPVPETNRLPGVDLAEGITATTGVAISPLLGVSVVGAWQYFRTPEAKRIHLPWFCHPAAWGIGLGILGLSTLKDVLGTGVPALLKKPFDVVELFENKASAAVASVAFIPFVANQISTHFLSSPENLAVNHSTSALLAVAPNQLFDAGLASAWILAPILGVAFLAVWLVCHSVNVLILLSPFGLIDVGLKTLRLALLGCVVAISAISPTLGAIFCVILIAVAIALAPWAFRLAVFGSVIAGDLAASIFYRSPQPEERVFGFLTHSENESFPARCGGWVTRDANGMLQLTGRRLLVGPSKSLKLAGEDEAILRKGLLFPKLSKLGDENMIDRPTVILLPRYRRHIDSIGEMFGIEEIRETLLKRGFHGMLSWLKETSELGRSKVGKLTRAAEPQPVAALSPGSGDRPGQS